MAKRTLYRVMLVEDQPADARLVREALAEHPAFSFQIVHFLQIEPALKFLERDAVDVALLDYNLPDVDNLDGLTRIIAVAPNLPVVMLTGLDDEATGLRMVQHGAQDYLVKGTVDGAMLVRTIRHAIERKGMSDRVRESEERFTLAAAGSGDGIWDWKIPTDRLVLSPRAKIILGLPEGSPDEDMEALSRRVHLDDVGRFRDAMAAHLNGETAEFRQQARIMDPNDQSRWVLVRGLAVIDAKGQARRMAGSITDLANLDAYYDAVTGLPNRALLIDRLGGVLKRRLRHIDCDSALLLVSLSCYSLINETLGHAASDTLMATAARTIEASVRLGDMVARVSTRGIAVVLDGVADVDEATDIAGRVCRALLAPIAIEEHAIVPTMRIGIVVTTAAYTDPETVMRDAAAALVAEPVTPICRSACSIRRCGSGQATGCGSKPRCGTRSNGTRCASFISRSSRWTAARFAASRPCCAGTTRSSATCRPRCSCRWPKRSASSRRSAPGCCAPPAARSSNGAKPGSLPTGSNSASASICPAGSSMVKARPAASSR